MHCLISLKQIRLGMLRRVLRQCGLLLNVAKSIISRTRVQFLNNKFSCFKLNSMRQKEDRLRQE